MDIARNPQDIPAEKQFLVAASPLTELNNWIQEYQQGKRRFTFTEEEVLKPIWQSGEDLRLREDSRFREITLFQQAGTSQWQLAEHVLVNEQLYEMLLDEQWDGHDLYQCLENLDKSSVGIAFHIFCQSDERFMLSQRQDGTHDLSLRANGQIVEFTAEQKRIVEQLAPELLAQCSNEHERRRPWTTLSLLEAFKNLSHISSVLSEAAPAALENWLLHQESWVRVGLDSWYPKDMLPSMNAGHRYAVLPVFSQTRDISSTLPTLVKEDNLKYDIEEEETHIEVREQQHDDRDVRWHVVLRTSHINEGCLPVPPKARSFYPHARRLAQNIAIPGLWVADGNEITAWLNRKQHRLFGVDLQDQFAFLEAGEVLEITWTSAGLIFRTQGVDEKVAEEEVRLIDLTRLAQLRSATAESYRRSLRTILSEAIGAMSLQEIYEELAKRQHHQPNRTTIRTILSSSPEFMFLRQEKKWTLNSVIPSRIGAKLLRRSTMVANEIESYSSNSQQKPQLFADMVTLNRRHISELRSLYFPESKSEAY